MSVNPNNFQFASGTIANDIIERDAGNFKLAIFTILVKERRYSKTNGAKTISEFIKCKAWGSTAKLIIDNYKKGDWVEAIGRCASEAWENSEGKKQYAQTFEVDSIRNLSYLMSQAGQGSGTQQPSGGSYNGNNDSGYGSDNNGGYGAGNSGDDIDDILNRGGYSNGNLPY